MKRSLISLAALALLSACSLAPVYQRPAAPVTPHWPQGDAYSVAPVAAGVGAAHDVAAHDVAWRDYFADARLREVIALALANNRDLRVSALNIEKARAQYGIERAAQLPSVSASGGQAAQHANGATSRQFNANLNVAYELDFFGKVRSLSEAALQQYLGTEEARRAQQMTLVAEVANAWLALQADRERLLLASETLKSQQITYALSQRRFDAGATSGLDMHEARTSVEAARNDVAVYTAQVAADENALVLLVGAPLPASLLAPLLAPRSAAGVAGAGLAASAPVVVAQAPDTLATVAAVRELPPGVPSEVLARRPDVLAAERTLLAANANIGAARAAFFPSISLTAAAGTASGDLSSLFKAGTGTWSFMPSVRLPIFDGGANRATLGVAQAERDIALARYEKAVQSAFREVADALAQRGTLDERLSSQAALVDAAQKSFRIHQARYSQGSESYLNALVSQRALYAAQQAMISARQAKASNQVALYKVLGGGAQ
ncbi:MAG: efflux transporter outer membrane subunit [Burkholderiaceae bacterium]|nr:efflux transporter outer membrane subunit [Burkholderiaceae bacterium]